MQAGIAKSYATRRPTPNNSRLYRENLRHEERRKKERTREKRGRMEEKEKELFTESFIYRRQIDSLSDQSVRPARKPLRLPPFLFDYFSSSAAGLAPARFLPPFYGSSAE